MSTAVEWAGGGHGKRAGVRSTLGWRGPRVGPGRQVAAQAAKATPKSARVFNFHRPGSCCVGCVLLRRLLRRLLWRQLRRLLLRGVHLRGPDRKTCVC